MKDSVSLSVNSVDFFSWWGDIHLRHACTRTHIQAHTNTQYMDYYLHCGRLLEFVMNVHRFCEWAPSYESKRSLKFKLIIPDLQLSSFKQPSVFRGEPDDLPEGVWVGGLWEQQNKLQNIPLHHITHWACNPPTVTSCCGESTYSSKNAFNPTPL